MKKSIIYICETCGKQSFDATEIIKCECKHLGITPDILTEWKRLKNKVEAESRNIYYQKNNENEQRLDDAIKDLIDFETQHNLTHKRIPDNI